MGIFGLDKASIRWSKSEKHIAKLIMTNNTFHLFAKW